SIGAPRANAYKLTTELKKNLRKRALLIAVAPSREIERGWPKGDFDHRVAWPEEERILASIIADRPGINDGGALQSASGEMRRGVRLLLVEDNVVFGAATAEYLKRSGLEVLTAGNGKDALAAAGGFKPEVVLCDLTLPDMSGLDLLQRLRSNLETKDAVLA